MATVRGWLLLTGLLSLLGVVGCGGGPTGSQAEPGEKEKDSIAVAEAKRKAELDRRKEAMKTAKAAAETFATNFLRALGARQAQPEALAPEFLCGIAPPISEDDQKLGYSPKAARGWLDRQGPATFTVGHPNLLGAGATAGYPGPAAEAWVSLRGTVSGDTGGHFGLLCLGSGDQCRIAWFYRSTVRGDNQLKQPDSHSLDTAIAFCDSLLGGDLEVAAALMAPGLKESLAGPLPGDRGHGYDWSRLRTLLRTEWKGDASGYTLTEQENGAGKVTTLAGELTGGARGRPFTLSMTGVRVHGGRSLWLVTDFKVR
jgi:hypothetical protein